MNAYRQRSPETELIDQPGIPFSDWAVCLRELNTINTLLGGHAITLKGVKRFLQDGNALTVMEAGCGGGDNLKAIYAWNRRRHNALQYIGVDLNEACIDFARRNCAEIPAASFIASDYRHADMSRKPDVIFTSLFCHHFTDDQLVDMLQWMYQHSNKGFFINDLHRHPFAYYSIKWLTAAFSDSYLVKNDAPISVMRGFRRREWKVLLQRAGIRDFSIEWKWAFRYLVIVKHG